MIKVVNIDIKSYPKRGYSTGEILNAVIKDELIIPEDKIITINNLLNGCYEIIWRT